MQARGKEFADLRDKWVKEPNLLADSVEKGIEYVKKSGYAMMMETPYVDYYTQVRALTSNAH